MTAHKIFKIKLSNRIEKKGCFILNLIVAGEMYIDILCPIYQLLMLFNRISYSNNYFMNEFAWNHKTSE